jgi:deoxyribonuclease-4
MAGQGTSLGSTLEELAAIRELVTEKRRVGFCVDTCHLFAAGYSLSSEQDYKDFWRQADKTLGISHIKVIHVNDSQKKQGSRIDRHENIGKGEIGLTTFTHIMNDHRFISVPKILETPNTTLDEYQKNKEILEGLISKK